MTEKLGGEGLLKVDLVLVQVVGTVLNRRIRLKSEGLIVIGW